MSAETLILPDRIHHATTCILQTLQSPLTDDAAPAVVDGFFTACHALPPDRSAADVVSNLTKYSAVSVRRLENAALDRFRQQLRRPQSKDIGSNTTTKLPRALTELRSAARAWRISPLVLLADLHQAPRSDNFWRLLSKLARCGRHSSWPAVRKRLQAARLRRQCDLLTRRKGVSHVQAWAIPDLLAVLDEDEKDKEQQVQPAFNLLSQTHEPAADAVKTTCDGGDDDDPRKDGSTANDKNGIRTDDGSDWSSVMQVKNSEQTTFWSLAYGWWLPGDIICRVCISLAQIQPDCAIIGVNTLESVHVPSLTAKATTLIAPLQIKTPLRWTLAILCPSERVVSVYDPLLINSSSQSDVYSTAAVMSALECVLAESPLGGMGQGMACDVSLTECAVVIRSCLGLTSSIESGVAIVVSSLYCIVGRTMPRSIDYYLWRRMLTVYLTCLPSDDASQRARDANLAAVFATNHMTLYKHISTTRPFRRGSTMALRDDAMEGRAVWMAAERLASLVLTGARSRRDRIMTLRLQHSDHAVEGPDWGSSLQLAEEHAASIAGVMNSIHAVLEDLDGLLAGLEKTHAEIPLRVCT